jgi:hypothetical protein
VQLFACRLIGAPQFSQGTYLRAQNTQAMADSGKTTANHIHPRGDVDAPPAAIRKATLMRTMPQTTGSVRVRSTEPRHHTSPRARPVYSSLPGVSIARSRGCLRVGRSVRRCVSSAANDSRFPARGVVWPVDVREKHKNAWCPVCKAERRFVASRRLFWTSGDYRCSVCGTTLPGSRRSGDPSRVDREPPPPPIPPPTTTG